jgi:hypothetical protein
MATVDEQRESFTATVLDYARRGGAVGDEPRRGEEALRAGCIACGFVLLGFAWAIVQQLMRQGGLWFLVSFGLGGVIYLYSFGLTLGASFSRRTARDLLGWAWAVALVQTGFWGWVVYGVYDLFSRHGGPPCC